MNSFLCADSTSAGTIVIYVVLILVLVAMLVMPYFTQRKKNKEFATMLDAIKVGDLVKTAGGIIGKVTKITDKGEIKTVILETGSKTEKSYMEFDMTMIYCVLKSTKVDASQSDNIESNETVVIGDEVSPAEENAEEAKPALAEETSVQTENAEVTENAETQNAEPVSIESKAVETATEKKTAKKPVAKKSTKTTSKTTTKATGKTAAKTTQKK